MNGAQIVVTVLGTVLIAVLGSGWRLYLKSCSDEKQLELEHQSRLQLSQHETERLKILASAMIKN